MVGPALALEQPHPEPTLYSLHLLYLIAQALGCDPPLPPTRWLGDFAPFQAAQAQAIEEAHREAEQNARQPRMEW